MRHALLALLLFSPVVARADVTLTVLAASSLRAPLEASASAFEREHRGTKVVISTAATGVLVKQVQSGAPADVLVGAALQPLLALAKEQLADAPVIIARNQLVVASQACTNLALTGLDGLRGPEFARIGIGRPKVVPAGDYAAQALGKAKLLDALQSKLVYAENVTQVLHYVIAGDVQAGFVYATDAQLESAKVRVLYRVPASMHEPIVYPAVALTRSSQRALAKAYVAYLRSLEGQTALRATGFLPP